MVKVMLGKTQDGEESWLGRLKTRRTAHPNSSDSRSLLSYLPKTSTPRAYFMVKAMLGKTQQGKKEVRATSQAKQEG